MTVAEAAEYLGITPRRVRELLNPKRGKPLLIGQKHGRDWWIQKRVVEAFAELDRPAHRPRKS